MSHTLSAQIKVGDSHYDQNPYVWKFQDAWEECTFERIAKEYAQRGENPPPLLLVCHCKKCTPKC